MPSGKAVTRAVRVHSIVVAALNALMLTNVLTAPLPIQPDTSNSNNNPEIATVPSDDLSDEVSDNQDMDEASVVYEKLVESTVYVEDTCRSDVLNRIKDRLHKHAESAKMSFRTASLWVEYMGMVDLLRTYIRAERTSNWALHLQTMQNISFHTWQPRATTCTPHLPGCICNRWIISRKNTDIRLWVYYLIFIASIIYCLANLTYFNCL